LILFKSDGGYSKRPRLFKTPAAQAARFTFAGGSTIGSCSAVRSTVLAVHRITQSVCVGLVKRVSYSLSDIPRNPNSRLLSVRFDCPGGVRASFQNCPSAFFKPAAQSVARSDDPVHAMAGADLGFGDQRRVPGRGRRFRYFPSRSSCR
jgi:hypothetical protein